MKKIKTMLSIFILLSINTINVYSQEIKSSTETNSFLDYQEVDLSFYGYNSFDQYDEHIFNKTNMELITLLKQISKDSSKIGELSGYLANINSNSLIGLTSRDSILLYINLSLNDELFKIIDKQLKKESNDQLQFIKLVRSNPKNYAFSSFNYSTMLRRKMLDFGISILLPNTNWQKMDYIESNNSASYNAGEGSNAGNVVLKKIKIDPLTYNIQNDHFYVKHQSTLLKGFPESGIGNIKVTDMYKVKPGKIVLIAENIQLNGVKIDKLYEQITISSETYNFQKLVTRTRFYLIEDTLYSVAIQSIIAGNHILADTDYLIIQHGLLLDTVKLNF